MARVFITGSADGLGKLAAQQLVAEKHAVVLHARSDERAREAMSAVRGAEQCVVGDLSSMAETKSVARQVNALGAFDAIIHNAGIGYQEPKRDATVDDLPRVFAVNTVATYLLTALIDRPKRLVYLSSGLHRGGDGTLRDLEWKSKRWDGSQAYSDSKLHDVLISFAAARSWPNVLSNAVDPGWVPTRMGGRNAPDDLAQGAATQAWLAVSSEKSATVSGEYFFHRRLREVVPVARDIAVQNGLIAELARISGVELPA